MKLIKSATAIAIALGTVTIYSAMAIAQPDRQQWVSFGKTNSGEILKLDQKSIGFRTMLVDDTINEEGGYESNLPRIEVVKFDYTIGGRKRSAYTKSCKGSRVTELPSWKTYTTFRDYWPQYFLVEADSIPSRKMLQQVCILSADRKS